jgi:hypothetical protein
VATLPFVAQIQSQTIGLDKDNTQFNIPDDRKYRQNNATSKQGVAVFEKENAMPMLKVDQLIFDTAPDPNQDLLGLSDKFDIGRQNLIINMVQEDSPTPSVDDINNREEFIELPFSTMTQACYRAIWGTCSGCIG